MTALAHGMANTYSYHKCRCEPCTATVREASRKATARRRAWLDEVKISAGCKDCGYDEHASALHFDHLPGYSKVAAISDMMSARRPVKVIEEEMAKCDVVCANCHAVRTFVSRDVS